MTLSSKPSTTILALVVFVVLMTPTTVETGQILKAVSKSNLLLGPADSQALTIAHDSAEPLTAKVADETNPVKQSHLPEPDIPEVDFGNYHALITGNNNYHQLTDLVTPINDARSIAKLLEDKYRFETEVLIDADRKTFLQALNIFRERLTENDNFLLYYAGHGIRDEKNDRCHWLPVDANPNSQENWISDVSIVHQINRMTAKHIMIIADSCFSHRVVRWNFGSSQKISAEYYKQLAKIRSRTALISGNTQPVLDGRDGNHSIFSNSLLNTLQDNNGIKQAPELFLEVHARMRALGENGIGEVQAPAFDIIQNTGDLGAPFFFVPE